MSQQQQQEATPKKETTNTTTTAADNVLFIVGAASSGKGTLCTALASCYNFEAISTGDVLRKEARSGSEVGKQIADIQARGALVPAEVAVSLLKKEISESKCRGILLDGFPRSDEQKKAWEDQMGLPRGVILLECDEEVMVKRALGRAEQAKASGDVVRSDDNIETLKKRFKTHQEQSVPVIETYRSTLAKKFCEINANRDPGAIREDAKCFLATLQIQPAS